MNEGNHHNIQNKDRVDIPYSPVARLGVNAFESLPQHARDEMFNRIVANITDEALIRELLHNPVMSLLTLACYEHVCVLLFKRDGDVCFLNHAVAICEHIVSRCPDHLPQKFMLFGFLGAALTERQLHNDAIHAYECALDIAVDLNDLHPLTTICYNQLGVLLKQRFDWFKDKEDLDRAIRAQELAIATCTSDSVIQQKMYYSQVAIALVTRWQLFHDVEDLDNMITHAEAWVELCPNDPLTHLLLGAALGVAFNHHQTLSFVDRAILTTQRILELIPENSAGIRVQTLLLLADLFHDRARQIGYLDHSDMVSCIQYSNEAFSLREPDTRRKILLGQRLMSAYEVSQDTQYLDSAISIFETLLADGTLEVLERCKVLFSLAVRGRFDLSQQAKFDHQGGAFPDSLEQLIQMSKDAVDCFVPGRQMDKCDLYCDLSAALMKQLCLQTLGDQMILRDTDLLGASHGTGGNHAEPSSLAAFQYAISIAKEAVSLASKDGLSERLPGSLLTLGTIIACQIQANHMLPNTDTFLEPLHECISIFRQAAMTAESPGVKNRGFRKVQMDAAYLWGLYAFIVEDSHSCMEAHTMFMDTVPSFIWLGFSASQQYSILAGPIQEKIIQSALFAIHFGFKTIALGWLDQSRSITWQKMIMLRAPIQDQVSKVVPELASRLVTVSQALQDGVYFDQEVLGKDAFEVAKQQQYHLAEEWDDLVNQVRLLPGFERFLQPKTAEYFTSLQFDGPVVVLSIMGGSCSAFILQKNSEIMVLHLPQMNKELALRLQQKLQTTLMDSGLLTRGSESRASKPYSRPSNNEVMSTILSELWTKVVKPILDFISIKVYNQGSEPPHLWWCPTGPSLSFLPWHAAGLYNTSEPGTKIYEYVASSYTPTVSILANILERQHSVEFKGLFAVSQPFTPGQQPIPKTEEEVFSIAEIATAHTDMELLTRDEATAQTVLDGMAKYSWIHLACHASQDPVNPLNSAFMLSDRPLRLSEIALHAHPHADFAFLSACQTATGDEKLSEEAVHLAAGMLMAGFNSVVATMWAVKDSDAPKVADAVYRKLFSGGKANRGMSGVALHHATMSLRKDVGERNFMSWVPFVHFGA